MYKTAFTKNHTSFDDYFKKKSGKKKSVTLGGIDDGIEEMTKTAVLNTPEATSTSAPPKTGSAVKSAIQGVLSKKYGELDTKHLFDSISDKDVEDNFETAESAIKTNLDRGLLSEASLAKLPNLRDGLALSYAAANKGDSKAATRAREAAYEKSEEPSLKYELPKLQNAFLSAGEKAKAGNQSTKYSNFYDDYQKNKSFPSNNNSWNEISKAFDLAMLNKNPRYVKADVLNMRSAPGVDSKVIGTLTNGTEVNYTGNKTKEIDGHLWAEVTYDGKTGWVAADYLKTDKPQSNSVSTSVAPQKNEQRVSMDSVNNGSKIDINDHTALKRAFNAVRKPGATDDNPGEAGDFDGVWGLQCVDLSNWFLDNYTTLGRVGGDGKDVVGNLARKYNFDVSTIPTAPAVYSVSGGNAGPGTTGRNDGGCGHTGVILSCKLTDSGNYELTYFHSYNSLLEKGKTSEIITKTFTPEQLKNTMFFDLSTHMS